MNHHEVQSIAEMAGFGPVSFEIRTALNTGKPIEVGYVGVKGKRVLFCKRSMNGDFRFCNQFSSLEGS